jgi:hypothetical protein
MKRKDEKIIIIFYPLLYIDGLIVLADGKPL